jgi:hypothetical protein
MQLIIFGATNEMNCQFIFTLNFTIPVLSFLLIKIMTKYRAVRNSGRVYFYQFHKIEKTMFFCMLGLAIFVIQCLLVVLYSFSLSRAVQSASANMAAVCDVVRLPAVR